MSRVHICTLYALCKIVENIVHLYIGFAWKLRPNKDKDASIQKIEFMICQIGLYGGNIKIEANMKNLRKEKHIPIKPSIGGVKDRR